LKDELAHIPFRFDTDVNAPALAEYKFYQQPGQTSCAYITVGTGIGVGLIINGKSVHGLLHPEAGHIQVAREEGDSFGGTCPFHGSCIEGMCSTGALAARANCLAADLPLIADDDKLWDTCAYYLAQLCVSLILIASPERIVIGGGVMNRATLYPKIRAKTAELLKGYIQQDRITSSQIDEYIKEPLWGSNSGIVGAAYLAQLAAEENDTRTP
jgi:fructokinase